MQCLKGAPVAVSIRDQLKEQLAGWEGRKPCLAIVRVGEREEDLSYERGAKKRMDSIGIDTRVYAFDREISMEKFYPAFLKINMDPEVDGILLFRPLPSQLDEKRIVEAIDPAKDIDGISSGNLAEIFMGSRLGFAPCTAQAVTELLHYYGIILEGKRVAVLGRSLVVGKPLAMLLLQENATVTMCHSRTRDIRQVCREADIVVSAIGKARWVDKSFLSPEAVVIDVGINTDSEGRLCGDVDFENICDIASKATPVPGGVGAVTTAVLAKHVVEAALRRQGGSHGLSSG